MGAPKINSKNMERAYSILKECSADSQHYLSFNEESEYYFGLETRGMISYIIAGKKAMSLGDPVCRFGDMERFTGEYINFCAKMGWKPIFNSVSGRMAEILKKLGFSVIKYGEEAILELSEYSLVGRRREALRRNVSNVGKSGATLTEYFPKNGRDYVLEEKIAALSEKWFVGKGFKLSYSVGDLPFDEPYDRRYFVTTDANGDLLTVLSFMPYDGGDGYCIDVMRRKSDSITGAMEHAIVAVAMKLKDEGVGKLSLGLAPLAGIDVSKPDVSRAEKLMNAIFNNMESGYNFKNLYRFKKKFDPSLWEPRYLVYHSGISLVDLAISITNTKRGSADLVLYAKYKIFLIAVTLGLYKTRNK
jgi:phosphatidylglycerol lysyltransferase